MRILFPDDATQVDVLASFEHTVQKRFCELGAVQDEAPISEERDLGEYLGASRAEVASVVVTDINGDRRGDVVLNW